MNDAAGPDHDRDPDRALAALLRFVAGNDGASTARAGKQLGLARSELARLLAVLAGDPGSGGLGLVAVHAEPGRERLSLTAAGRAWLEAHR